MKLFVSVAWSVVEAECRDDAHGRVVPALAARAALVASAVTAQPLRLPGPARPSRCRL